MCLLFLIYCFGILFCFCFKCGLFKKPKIVVLSALHRSGTDLGLDSTEIITPKHSASSTSSGSSNSSSRFYPNRRRTSKKPRKKSHSNRYPRSPTARAFSNNAQSQQQFIENGIYFEYDNDSPFLVPVQQNSRRKTKNRQTTSSYCNGYTSEPTEINRPTIYSDEFNTLLRLPNELNNTPIHEQQIRLDTESGDTVSLETRSSLEFGASLMQVIENAENDIRQEQSLIQHEIQTASPAPLPTYYHDEKPPSYDDIIRRNY